MIAAGRLGQRQMNLYDIPIFGMLRAKLDWLNERQRVLAENISNASTQSYKAKDLKAPSFSDLMHMAQDEARKADNAPGMPGTTPPMGVPGVPNAQGITAFSGPQRPDAPYKPEVIEDGEMTPNGNSVVLEEQMMKVAETQTEFQSAVEIYRKGIDLLHVAIGSGS